METIGNCKYCGDPIYDFQQTDSSGKYHKGCKEILEENKPNGFDDNGNLVHYCYG